MTETVINNGCFFLYEVKRMECFIGLDIGTSAVKAALMTCDGSLLAVESKTYHYFYKGEAKLLSPDVFAQTCLSTIRKLAATLSPEHKIIAICSCCASGNLLMLDENNRPIIPIIGWQTSLSQEEVDSFYTKEEQEAFYETVGWPLDRDMPAVYLAAIKKHRPDLIQKASVITMHAEYLNFLLTGKWGLTHSMGTPSYLMDQEKGVYNKALLEKLGIKESTLPPIYKKGTVLGNVTPEIAKSLYLSEDTKIVLGTFDHPSGALGAGVFEEGDMLLSCGTSWVEFFPVKSRSFAISTKGLVDRFLLDGCEYCVMKSLSSITDKINKHREHFFGRISHAEFDKYVSQSSLGCNGLVFDFTEGDDARAEGHSRADIARAIIEGAALKLKTNLEKLRSSGLRADNITIIGGITNSKPCTQVISQVLGVKLKSINGQSAGAIGACLLAGIGVGVYANEKEAFEVMKSKLK